MKAQFEKNAGIALVLFTLLMVVTIVLHPVGGSFAHLLKTINIIVITHAIALISIPFAAVGFWGLTKRIGTDNFFSISAFAIVLFALVAGMMAATCNGLVLPIFIQKYSDASGELIETIKPILKYNLSLNNAFDYIFSGAFCAAILLWSMAILYTKRLPVWIAYLGIILFIVAAFIFVSGFRLIDLKWLRLFVSIIILWIIVVGISLIRNQEI